MYGEIFSKLDVGRQGAMFEANGGLTKRLSLKIAKITGINIDTNTMSLSWLWPYPGGVDGVNIGAPYWGFRSGIRFTPEVGSIVVIGYAKDKIVPLSYLPPSDYSYLLSGQKDNQGNRTYAKKIAPGDIQIRSSRGAEIYLNDKVNFGDPDNNSISIDPNTGNIYINSINLITENEAGYQKMGQITRNGNVITDDGTPVTNINGGNALNELKISIKELSDSSSIITTQSNPSIADISIGTLVDANGEIIINTLGNEIACDIKMASGARIQIDKKGLISINNANAVSPTGSVATPSPIQSYDDLNFYKNTPVQRAAREGDRIEIPLTQASSPDLNHPNMVNKINFNLEQLSLLAPMFLSPAGPCVFIPSTPDVKFLGEIVQGANGVLIGSLDKQAEAQEYSAEGDDAFL